MVSLSSIEAILTEAFPDFAHALLSVPDQMRGEQLVLITTAPDLDRRKVAEGLKQRGASDMMIPRKIIHVDKLPVLGSGKTDYVALSRFVQEAAAT
jgi:acyl-[acyl-carrier-protein]-phospholipid O-acyltransferase/long-chain-fatty-acid--[acyl-carrier-protein] ligase